MKHVIWLSIQIHKNMLHKLIINHYNNVILEIFV